MPYTVNTILLDSTLAHTRVSFELPYRDWCLLEKSIQWENFLQLLEEVQNKGNQTSSQVQADKLEMQ